MNDGSELQLRNILQDYGRYLSGRVTDRLSVKMSTPAVMGAVGAGLAAFPLTGPIAVITFAAAAWSKRRKDEAVNTPQHQVELALSEISGTICDDSNVVEFMSFRDKIIGPSAPDSRPSALDASATSLASDRFRRFLTDKELGSEEVDRLVSLHQEFVASKLPELEVLAAVQELRDQFRGPDVDQRKPYPGRKTVSAKSFLLEEYTSELIDGTLTAGRLQALDKSLYNALYEELRGESPPQSVSDFMQKQVDPSERRPKRYARRAQACAIILDAPAIEAGRFLGNMRVERIAHHESQTSR